MKKTIAADLTAISCAGPVTLRRPIRPNLRSHSMRAIQTTFASLAFVCGSVWADGAPLFSKGQGITSTEVASIKASSPEATKVESVVLNRDAIYSKIITATIDGKDFRFVGGPVEGGAKDVKTWAGVDGPASMILALDGRNVSGQVRFADRYFEIRSSKGIDMLIEFVDTRDFTPEATAAARAAAQKKKAKP